MNILYRWLQIPIFLWSLLRHFRQTTGSPFLKTCRRFACINVLYWPNEWICLQEHYSSTFHTDKDSVLEPTSEDFQDMSTDCKEEHGELVLGVYINCVLFCYSFILPTKGLSGVYMCFLSLKCDFHYVFNIFILWGRQQP